MPGRSKKYVAGKRAETKHTQSEFLTEIQSGLPLIHQEINTTKAVHCGLIIDTGSRDEPAGKHGMAHFIEHMIFKGTGRRKTYHILNAVESVGGELNAYTTKEKTCLYASLPANEIERGFDVLADIFRNPVFPEKEIAKERQVISEEIDMYRDNPEEAIFEDFDTLVFPNHPLSHPILGTKKSISGFNREKIHSFYHAHYTPKNAVLSVAGNVNANKVHELAEKYFGDMQSGRAPIRKKAALRKGATELEASIGGNQAHCVVGGKAFPLGKGKDVALNLLINYLGGVAGNSRLNMEVREKLGLSYSIYSYYQPFIDTGIWGVYFGCEPGNVNRVRSLILRELKQLRKNNPGSLLLHRIKKQALGQLVLGNEYPQTLMLAAGKNLLDFGRNIHLPELIRWVEAVTESDLMQAAAEVFREDKIQTLIYKPE